MSSLVAHVMSHVLALCMPSLQNIEQQPEGAPNVGVSHDAPSVAGADHVCLPQAGSGHVTPSSTTKVKQVRGPSEDVYP